MPGVSIPAKHSSESSGGGAATYLDTIDGSYNVYNARLMSFIIPNAWNNLVNTSQARRGLASIPNRYNQNAAWDSQYAVSTVSGNTDLDLYSVTNEFDSNISTMEAIQFKAGSYTDGYPHITFNETSDKIQTVRNSVLTSTIVGSQAKKTYMGVSGGNYFVYVASGATIKTMPCNSSGVISSATPGDTETIATCDAVFVLAAKNQYVWLGISYYSGGHLFIKGALYSINSSGVMTQVGATVNVRDYNVVSAFSGSRSNFFGSYVKNNTAYCFGITYGRLDASNAESAQSYFTVDLTNTAAFTSTEIRGANVGHGSNTSGPYGMGQSTTQYLQVGYNGTKLLGNFNGDIYELDASSFTDSTSNAVNDDEWMRYTNSISKMSTTTLNIYGLSTAQYINGTACSGALSSKDRVMAIYTVTGTNEDDDSAAFKNLLIETAGALSEDLYVELKLNGDLYYTFNNSVDGLMSLSSNTDYVVDDTSITQHMDLENTALQQVKMGFGLTGGTYSVPTGTNGHGGSITTGSTVSANGNYMDLSLA